MTIAAGAVALNIIYNWKGFVDGLMENDNLYNVASSKRHAKFKTRVIPY